MTSSTRFFASILLLFLCGSCHKTKILGPCTGNCQVVHFTGKAYDPGGQKPLANLSVKVDMPRKQYCLYCGPYQVASGSTKADGTFDLTTSVDTSIVAAHYCNISVQGPAKYIVYAEPAGPGSEPTPYSNILELPLQVDPTGMATYEEYDFFQPVLLTVRLHRTAAILRSEPFLSLSFILGPSSTSAWELNETAGNADTALTLYTGANVFTRVNYIQFLTDSTKENLTDSIRCVSGGNNSIDINYP